MVKIKSCKTCGLDFEKTGQADKHCRGCRKVKDGKPKSCTTCGESLPVRRGPKKFCKACGEKAVASREYERSIKKSEGRFCDVSFHSCIVCKKWFSRDKSRAGMVDACGGKCLKLAYDMVSKQNLRWRERPFQFRLDKAVVALGSRLRRSEADRPVGFCEFCGCAKVMGDAQARSARKGKRFFCDQDCSNNWKAIYYASKSFDYFERSREATRNRKLAEKMLSIEMRQAKMLETIERNRAKREQRKQKGWVTCTVCSKTFWSESRSSKKCFCSDQCRKEAHKAHSGNRRHLIRDRSFGAVITLKKLFKRDGGRCKVCNTKCVKPEGYNQPNEANIDHIMPLSKGGLHIWSNVQLLCRSCNIAKSDKVLPGTQLMLNLECRKPGHRKC